MPDPEIELLTSAPASTTTTTEVRRPRRRAPALAVAAAALAAVGFVVSRGSDSGSGEPAALVDDAEPSIEAPGAETTDDATTDRARQVVLSAGTELLDTEVRLRVSPLNGRLPQLVLLSPDGTATTSDLPPASRFELDARGRWAELSGTGVLTAGPDATPIDVEVSSFAWHEHDPDRLVYLTGNRSDGVDLVEARLGPDTVERRVLAADLDPSLGGTTVHAVGELGIVLGYNTFRTLRVFGPDGTLVTELDADHVGTVGTRWLFAERTGERFLFDPADATTDDRAGVWNEPGTLVRRAVTAPDGSRTALHLVRGRSIDDPGAVQELHVIDERGQAVVEPITDVRADTSLRWRADGAVVAFTPTLDDERHRIGLLEVATGTLTTFTAPRLDLGPPEGSAPVRTDLGVIVVDRREETGVRVTDVLP